MFKGKKAWFSQSVDGELCQLWEAEGGIIDTHHHAEYLFSSDASHYDTKRIHNSLDYVENKATVFHASFIKANTRSNKMLSLGHFILPPACVHDAIKRTIGSFIWEQSSSPLMEQKKTKEEISSQSKNEGFQNKLTSPSTLQNRSTCTQRAVFLKERNLYQLSERGIRDEILGSDRGFTGEGIYCTLRNYPVNNMFTGYVSVDEMTKFAGELHDFTPNTSEYQAFYVQDESNVFSVVKNMSKK
ncbi:telomere repeats-binding bouquet formation protein 2 [Pelodytes ibericus]